MRPTQKSNRSRGRGNRKGGGGGGGNNINRVYDSAGPEGKVRGTPQQIIDKYLSLARDAQTSGDRVAAENFLQHAEHYQRILIQANQSQEQARREAQQAATDQMADRGNEAMSQPGQQPQGHEPQPHPAQHTAQQPETLQPHAAQPMSAPAQQSGAQPAAGAMPIGGMTTIDSSPTDSGLLIDGEELPKPRQRRSNGESRTRRPRQKSEIAPKAEAAETATAPSPSADTPPTEPAAAKASEPATPAVDS